MARPDLPAELPSFCGHTLNLNGALVRNQSAKLRKGTSEHKGFLIRKHLLKAEKSDIVFLQETHWAAVPDAVGFLRNFKGQTRGVAFSDQRGKRGVATLIPRGSPLYNCTTDLSKCPQGRWALIRIDAKNDFMHVVNFYCPAEESDRPAFFNELMTKFTGYHNLVFVGDWNFVECTMDKLTLNGQPKSVAGPKAHYWVLT